MASRSRKRGRVGEHDAPERRPIERPIGAQDPGPNRATTASSAGSPGLDDLARDLVGIDDDDPGRSPSQPATVDLPHPIGPVNPIRTVTARRSSRSSHASSAAASATSMSASSLVTRRISTKFACTAGSPIASSRWFFRNPSRVSSPSAAAFCRRYASLDSFSFFPFFRGGWCRCGPCAEAAADGRREDRRPLGAAPEGAGSAPPARGAPQPGRLQLDAVATVQPPAPPLRHSRYPPSNPTADPSPTTHSLSHTVSSNRRSCDTTSSVAGDRP